MVVADGCPWPDRGVTTPTDDHESNKAIKATDRLEEVSIVVQTDPLQPLARMLARSTGPGLQAAVVVEKEGALDKSNEGLFTESFGPWRGHHALARL